MAVIPSQIQRQLEARFQERLREPVELTLYTRPSAGRLILPSGMGCATCDDARQLAEALEQAAPEHISLKVVDITSEASSVQEVPTLTVAPPGEEPRVRWQGLPAGYEFSTVVDAIERISADGHGLGETSLQRLGLLTEPLEVMVFTTPT